jgi:hypothetical protein
MAEGHTRAPKGKDWREIRHRGWRDFDSVRRRATNAVTGLALGLDLLRLEAETRAREGDFRPTGEVLGDKLPAAKAFSFSPADTFPELAVAEEALAQMAVPLAVSLYNEYVVDVVELYDGFRRSAPPKAPSSMTLDQLHEYLTDQHGVARVGRQHALLDLLVAVRNSIIHRGGRVSHRVVECCEALPPEALEAWERVASQPFPTVAPGEPLVMGRGEAIASLATADHAASELNREMQRDFTNAFWADLAVAEYRALFPDQWRHPLARLNNVVGFVQHEYASAAQLAREDLAEAVDRAV